MATTYKTTELIEVMGLWEEFKEGEKPKLKSPVLAQFLHDCIGIVLSDKVPMGMDLHTNIYLQGVLDTLCIMLGHPQHNNEEDEPPFPSIIKQLLKGLDKMGGEWNRQVLDDYIERHIDSKEKE